MVKLETTISDIIHDVCEQNGFHQPEIYYLAFNNDVLENDKIVRNTNLHILATSSNIPELHTKTSHLLKTYPHFGKYVVFTSPEILNAAEILNIQLPLKIEDVIPDNVKKVFKKIDVNKGLKQSISAVASSHSQPSNPSTLVPLPVFSHTIIDDLPIMKLKVPLNPDEFDWQILLQNLADDLGIDKDDLVILEATNGSTIIKIALKQKVLRYKEKLKKIHEKAVIIIIDKFSKVMQYIDKLSKKLRKDYQVISGIHVELDNFDKVLNDEILIPDDIDLFYELNERPTVLDSDQWKFFEEKSRQIKICISDSFKNCEVEYVISSMAMVYNEKLQNDFNEYSSKLSVKDERILWHGVKSKGDFDGIFEENFRFTGTTDSGYFGRGIYLTSSPKYATQYAYTGTTIRYILCSVVSLGKMLHITNMDYYGKNLHPGYDSHYVKVDTSAKRNQPIANNNEKYYEEFVIKNNKQILPMYIVGLRQIDRFVLWRDAKIRNYENAHTFKRLKETYNCNIYGSETSDHALMLLKNKLSTGSQLCVVVTNGADDGEGFAIQCRKIRANLPIIVYCMDIASHKK
ncbi:unnamed protein product [Rotaria sp. Silwood1]|nr:unnamed protein product [Rotaria sp. Silwood1]